MVLALARCKRAKLKVAADVLLGRREDPATAPPTFCGFDNIGAEGVAVLEKCGAVRSPARTDSPPRIPASRPSAPLRCYCRYCATSKLHAESADLRDNFPAGRVMQLRPFEAPLPPEVAPGSKQATELAEVWDAVWVSPEGEGHQ